MNKVGLLIAAATFSVVSSSATFAEDVARSPAVEPAATSSAPTPTPTPTPATATTANAAVKATDVAPIDVPSLKSGQTTLKVGHYNQLPPFYFSDPNTQRGFGHETLMAVTQKAGIQNVSLIGFDSSTDLNAKLQQGKIDVIANAWDLPGMRKKFLLTVPYYTKGGLSFLYFRQKGSFQTVEDIKGHTIGVFKHGYADRYWLPAHGVSKNSITAYPTIKDLMFALKDGYIDVAVVYYPLARLAQRQLTDQLASTLVQPINDVYAVRQQDTELQKTLDTAIQALAADGTLNKIQAQYFEPTEKQPAAAQESPQAS